MSDDPKAVCLELLHAESEADVIEILRKQEYWEDEKVWRDFGDNDNNYSTAGAQQSDPVAALVEKLVNSADARLTNECMMLGIDPESDAAPRSVREAVGQLIEKAQNTSNETVGRIENWTASQRRENAQKITLAATGLRGSPCFSIADSGEGQTPDAVPNTFMSLNKSNKLRTPFVQGKFNMGGTGVFRFCGDRSLQLLITRRNPSILSGENDGDMWSFTVVRRDDPTGGERSSVIGISRPSAHLATVKVVFSAFKLGDTGPRFSQPIRIARQMHVIASHHYVASLFRLNECRPQRGVMPAEAATPKG